MEINTIYNEDCIFTMKRMIDESIDLVVTSPPYDAIRSYNKAIDLTWNEATWKPIIKELYRVIKKNGVVVWVVGDATVKGTESGTSFKQALWFMDCGFRLHDTMIYEKNSSAFPARRDSTRYTQIFEYMFIFSKGTPKCSLICDKANKWAGYTNWGRKVHYTKDGTLVEDKKKIKPIPQFSPRNNIWKYSTGFNDRTSHPAVFPEILVKDHILTWSSVYDIVYDPFMGSGTTAKMAIINSRNYIGSEINEHFCLEAKERIDKLKK